MRTRKYILENSRVYIFETLKTGELTGEFEYYYRYIPITKELAYIVMKLEENSDQSSKLPDFSKFVSMWANPKTRKLAELLYL